MAQQTINVGTAPNDGTGTPLRTAFQYTNSNFSELYTAVGPSGNNIVVPGTATITGDLTVDTNTLKVDSANNRVIVGHTSGSSAFQVTNAGAAGIEIQPTGFSSAPLILSYNRSAPAYTQLTLDGSTIVHALSGSTAMTLNSTGLNIANGNVILGTSGKGIDFSATANSSGTMTSELLNDYEEGTWTPSLVFGGANVGMTGTFAGRYTKVGRAVTINGIIALTAKGSSTGNAKLTGLPFISANAAAEYTAVSLRLDRISFLNVPCGYIGSNVIVVELENTTNAGTVTNLTDANFINTSVLILNCTYSV